jgi:hypothetical protein
VSLEYSCVVVQRDKRIVFLWLAGMSYFVCWLMLGSDGAPVFHDQALTAAIHYPYIPLEYLGVFTT